MARWLSSDRVLAIQRKAVQNGGQVRQLHDGAHSRLVEWDIAGDCQAPVLVEVNGRPEAGGARVVTRRNPSRFLDMYVSCRKCENCLRRRAAKWRLRAYAEWRCAPRTWLCTLTLRPAALVHLLSRARVRLGKAGTDLETLDQHNQFLEIEKEGFADIQRWLKRLRKAGHKVRYLAVTERHKSGVPHWHLLLHETDPLRPSRESELTGTWGLGFDSFRLVRTSQAAGYVAKYLSKSLSARVRASQGYGNGDIALAALGGNQVIECTQVHEERRSQKGSPPERGGLSDEGTPRSGLAGGSPRMVKGKGSIF